LAIKGDRGEPFKYFPACTGLPCSRFLTVGNQPYPPVRSRHGGIACRWFNATRRVRVEIADNGFSAIPHGAFGGNQSGGINLEIVLTVLRDICCLQSTQNGIAFP